jgi:hypothetical protein
MPRFTCDLTHPQREVQFIAGLASASAGGEMPSALPLPGSDVFVGTGLFAHLLPTMLARVLKRREYKQAGDWRIVDPRVWNAAQAALAGRRKRAA